MPDCRSRAMIVRSRKSLIFCLSSDACKSCLLVVESFHRVVVWLLNDHERKSNHGRIHLPAARLRMVRTFCAVRGLGGGGGSDPPIESRPCWSAEPHPRD